MRKKYKNVWQVQRQSQKSCVAYTQGRCMKKNSKTPWSLECHTSECDFIPQPVNSCTDCHQQGK